MAIEEHGAGRQLVRCELRPRSLKLTLVIALWLLALAVAAAADGAPVAAAVLGTGACGVLAGIGLTEAAAMGHLLSAVESHARDERPLKLRTRLETPEARPE
jgi:hypothetical protein